MSGLCRSGRHVLAEVGVYVRPDGDGVMCRGCIKLRSQRRRAKINVYVNQWRREHPERLRAQSAVWRAVRSGRLVKPSACEDCGKETRLHGHHADYDKQLEVEWLCPTCHSLRHQACGKVHP